MEGRTDDFAHLHFGSARQLWIVLIEQFARAELGAKRFSSSSGAKGALDATLSVALGQL